MKKILATVLLIAMVMSLVTIPTFASGETRPILKAKMGNYSFEDWSASQTNGGNPLYDTTAYVRFKFTAFDNAWAALFFSTFGTGQQNTGFKASADPDPVDGSIVGRVVLGNHSHGNHGTENADYVDASDPITMNLNEWHTMAVYQNEDGTYSKMYFDGVLVAEGDTSALNTSTKPYFWTWDSAWEISDMFVTRGNYSEMEDQSAATILTSWTSSSGRFPQFVAGNDDLSIIQEPTCEQLGEHHYVDGACTRCGALDPDYQEPKPVQPDAYQDLQSFFTYYDLFEGAFGAAGPGLGFEDEDYADRINLNVTEKSFSIDANDVGYKFYSSQRYAKGYHINFDWKLGASNTETTDLNDHINGFMFGDDFRSFVGWYYDNATDNTGSWVVGYMAPDETWGGFSHLLTRPNKTSAGIDILATIPGEVARDEWQNLYFKYDGDSNIVLNLNGNEILDITDSRFDLTSNGMSNPQSDYAKDHIGKILYLSYQTDVEISDLTAAGEAYIRTLNDADYIDWPKANGGQGLSSEMVFSDGNKQLYQNGDNRWHLFTTKKITNGFHLAYEFAPSQTQAGDGTYNPNNDFTGIMFGDYYNAYAGWFFDSVNPNDEGFNKVKFVIGYIDENASTWPGNGGIGARPTYGKAGQVVLLEVPGDMVRDDDAFNNVVFTHDGDQTLSMYINGVLIGFVTDPHFAYTGAEQAKVEADGNGWSDGNKAYYGGIKLSLYELFGTTKNVMFTDYVKVYDRGGCQHPTWIPATCTEPAKCADCGETRGSALGHTLKDGTAPTCTEDGICGRCGITPNTTENPEFAALGHNFGPYHCTVAPTCSRCGITKPDWVGGTHTYTDQVIPPTCTAQGYTKHTCSICGDTYNDSEVPANGHDYAVLYTVAPTCAVAGYDYVECTVCGDKTTNNETAKLAHNPDSLSVATCTQASVCADCGQPVGNPAAHDYVDNKCTVCSYTSGSANKADNFDSGKHSGNVFGTDESDIKGNFNYLHLRSNSDAFASKANYGDFSMVMVINAVSLDGSFGYALGNGIKAGYDVETQKFFIDNNGAVTYSTDTFEWKADRYTTWYDLIVKRSGNTIKLSVDGVEMVSLTDDAVAGNCSVGFANDGSDLYIMDMWIAKAEYDYSMEADCGGFNDTADFHKLIVAYYAFTDKTPAQLDAINATENLKRKNFAADFVNPDLNASHFNGVEIINSGMYNIKRFSENTYYITNSQSLNSMYTIQFRALFLDSKLISGRNYGKVMQWYFAPNQNGADQGYYVQYDFTTQQFVALTAGSGGAQLGNAQSFALNYDEWYDIVIKVGYSEDEFGSDTALFVYVNGEKAFESGLQAGLGNPATTINNTYWRNFNVQWIMDDFKIGPNDKFTFAHTHDWVAGEVVDPTCTAGGYTPNTCSICGETTNTDETEALGHDWDEGVVTAPTCIAGGYTTRTCSVCDETEQYDETEIDPDAHNWEQGVCTLCGAINYGDVNGDGVIDDIDDMLLTRYLAQWPDIDIIEATADVNGDGEIDEVDNATLARYLAQWPDIVLGPVEG